MDNEQFRKMKESQDCTDPIVEAVLKKCIDIYNEIHKETKNLDENIYERFPLVAYIEQQRTIPGKTRLSSVRVTIDMAWNLT